MRITQSYRGEITKEAETAEDYLLLEIERLKQENEELKQEILNLRNDRFKQVCFLIDSETKKGKYELSIEEKAIFITKIEEAISNE